VSRTWRSRSSSFSCGCGRDADACLSGPDGAAWLAATVAPPRLTPLRAPCEVTDRSRLAQPGRGSTDCANPRRVPPARFPTRTGDQTSARAMRRLAQSDRMPTTGPIFATTVALPCLTPLRVPCEVTDRSRLAQSAPVGVLSSALVVSKALHLSPKILDALNAHRAIASRSQSARTALRCCWLFPRWAADCLNKIRR